MKYAPPEDLYRGETGQSAKSEGPRAKGKVQSTKRFALSSLPFAALLSQHLSKELDGTWIP
jgi:hypothetical protein